ncbi:MAG: hypothetical protein DRP42_05215 [Tenericutes bacterium]|nr:MAG: hypothetical protein DRP42_05215 [Mycoplasmatota bacterium]
MTNKHVYIIIIVVVAAFGLSNAICEGAELQQEEAYVVRTGFNSALGGYVNFTCNPVLDGIKHTSKDSGICQKRFSGADHPMREMRPGDEIKVLYINGRFVAIQTTD